MKRRNPYALQFSIPDKCLEKSMLVGVRIIRNGIPLGVRQVKCESRLRELDQILRAHDNPLEFMCQVLNLSLNFQFSIISSVILQFLCPLYTRQLDSIKENENSWITGWSTLSEEIFHHTLISFQLQVARYQLPKTTQVRQVHFLSQYIHSKSLIFYDF